MGGQIPNEKHYHSFQMIVRELSFLLEGGHLLILGYCLIDTLPPDTIKCFLILHALHGVTEPPKIG